MVKTKREVATLIAKEAAKAAYTSVMNVQIKKHASGNYRMPSHQEIAKLAGNAAYKAVMKLGQAPPPAAMEANKPLAVRCPQCPTIAKAIDLGEPVNLDLVEQEWPALMAAENIGPDEKARIKEALQGAGARI